MEHLVEQILRSPKLGIYYAQIGDALAQEKTARERFYEQITENDKAEFINGEPVFHSPVRFSHNDSRSKLNKLASTFVEIHQLGYVGDEKLMISLTRNDYEPDVCFWRSEISSKFQPEQMRFPAPDWIAEVLSPSTEANDRGVKFEDYAAHGVSEYWIVDSDQKVIEQYLLTAGGQYELHIKSDTGTLRSSAIRGFEIPVKAVFDDAENLATLRKFLAT